MASDELKELLDKAKDHVMTDEEREAQRQSWARGQAMQGPRQAVLVQDGGGTKFDAGKVRMELFPPELIRRLLLEEKHTGKVDSVEDHFTKFADAGDYAQGRSIDQLYYTLVALAREMGVTVWGLIHNVSVILTFGATKYGDHNWRRGMKWSRLIGAALRHLSAHRMGQELDEETGKPHLWHFGCCVVFLLSFAIDENGTDDRYRPETVAVGNA